MKRFIVLVSALFCMSYAQDVAGSWTLTAVDVYYYNFARPADLQNPSEGSVLTVSDTYGLGAVIPVTEIPVGSMFLGVPNGPFGEPELAANGVNLNVTLYSDGTGMIPVGSTYPDIELDEESCTTFGQVLPVTDDVRYASNASSGEVLPLTNIVGLPSRNPYAGTAMGSLSLSQSVVFSFFPLTPAQTWTPVPLFFGADADTPGAVQVDADTWILPGTTMTPDAEGKFYTAGKTGGWIKTSDWGYTLEDGTTQMSIGGPNNPTPELGLYWHTVDGESADTGLGDDDTDEDGDGGPMDRIFGLPAFTATYIDPTVAASLGFAGFNHLVAGDITEQLAGLIQAGCEAQVASNVATCNAAGLDAFVFGLCGQTAAGADFAAACGAAGVATAVEGACINAGGPSTADEAAAVGSPVTCADIAASYAQAAAADGDSSNDCAEAVALATDSNANSLCSLAGAIALGTSTCEETVAAGAADGFVDMDGDGDVGCDDIAAATVAVGTNVTTTDDYADAADANTLYLMNPDPAFAPWSQFVTYNSYVADLTGSPDYLVNDSGHELVWKLAADDDGPATIVFLNASGVPCAPGTAGCLPVSLGADGAPGTGDEGGRLVLKYTPTCIPVIESMEVQTEFVGLAEGECTHNGDVDGSNSVDVLDVVALVQNVIGNTTLTDEQSCRADINSDNGVDVLDVVAIVNLIVSGRGEIASNVEFKRNNNTLNMVANGTVGAVQMTLSHGADFAISLTDNAFVAESNTTNNQTVMLVVLPENGELFTASGEFTIDEVIAASAEGYIETSMPASFNLGQAYPNPFNPTTSLDIELSFDSNVSIAVYNVMGQMVSVLHDGNMTSGMHSLTWDASNLSSGMYIIKAEVADEVLSQKVMLVK